MKKAIACFSLVLLLVIGLLVPGCNKEEEKGEVVKLVAAGEATFAPFEYTDEKGNLLGFDVDLIKAIAKAEGFEVEYKNLDWNSLIAALQTGEVDLVVSGMTINDERALEVAFSDPYFASGQAWAVPEGSPMQTIHDLSGHTVAVQINTTGDFAAQKLDATFKDEGKAGLTIKRLENAADVFNELKTGGCDAVISDLPVIKEYLKNHPDDKVVVPEPAFTVEYYGIAMRKQDKDIHSMVNKGLAKTKAAGEYDEIYQKYFGDD